MFLNGTKKSKKIKFKKQTVMRRIRDLVNSLDLLAASFVTNPRHRGFWRINYVPFRVSILLNFRNSEV